MAKHDVARKAMTNHGSDKLGTPTNAWVCEERPISAVGLKRSTRVLLRASTSLELILINKMMSPNKHEK
ncbi:hypothetical protein QYF36_025594 [Acer negundo]|nr:hypothetical protein QYF36_025594 [Acer negundo]